MEPRGYAKPKIRWLFGFILCKPTCNTPPCLISLEFYLIVQVAAWSNEPLCTMYRKNWLSFLLKKQDDDRLHVRSTTYIVPAETRILVKTLQYLNPTLQVAANVDPLKTGTNPPLAKAPKNQNPLSTLSSNEDLSSWFCRWRIRLNSTLEHFWRKCSLHRHTVVWSAMLDIPSSAVLVFLGPVVVAWVLFFCSWLEDPLREFQVPSGPLYQNYGFYVRSIVASYTYEIYKRTRSMVIK